MTKGIIGIITTAGLVLVLAGSIHGCKKPGGTAAPSTQEEAFSAPEAKKDASADWVEEGRTAVFLDVLPAGTPPEFDPATVAKASEGMNAFAVDLWGKMRTLEGNLAVSPASISIAFAMLLPGARGKTAEEMKHVMHFDLPDEEHDRAYASILGEWNEEKEGYELAAANRLFGEKSVTYEQEFLERAAGGFGAPLIPVSFMTQPEPARKLINAWVAEQTKDRIRNLVPEGAISNVTRIALVNALYFKGSWARKFDEIVTEKEDFLVGGTTPAPVQMMRQKAWFGYGEHGDDGVKTLKMPYEGKDLCMIVVLPLAEDGLGAVEESLDAGKLKRWLAPGHQSEVKVKLPKFVIDPPMPIKLKKTLMALGMTAPFSEKEADLTGIAKTSPGLMVDEAFHKAFVEVNEKGTEAAAATAIVGDLKGRSADEPPPTPTFYATHPFLFFIVDNRTGVVLFMGRVADPTT